MTGPFTDREAERPTASAAPSGDEAGRGRRGGKHGAGAPWVRTRLRATPVAALLTGVLVFVAVLLAAALPRALDRGSDQALRSFLHDSGPGPTSLYATAKSWPGQAAPQNLDEVLAVLRSRIGPGFDLAAGGPVHGARGIKPRGLTNPELDRPENIAPLLNLMFLPEAGAHTRLVEGRWPSGGADGGPVPVALSKSAADTLRARVGTVLETSSLLSEPISAEVVGLYAPEDPADAYWTDLTCAIQACAPTGVGWLTTALVGPDALGRLGPWGAGSADFWRLPVDTDSLHAARLPDVASEIAAYVTGPTAAALARDTRRDDLRITSQLPELFTEARDRQQAAAPLAAIGPAGVAGVALVVFCLAAGLTGDRRQAELRLLRARGGSRGGIVRRLLGEGAVTVLPAAALATALAVLLLPAPRLVPSLLAAGAVTLVALSAFPVRAFVLMSPPRGAAPRRRLVAELLVLAATAAAVVEVRRRGVAPVGTGLDPLLVAAPLLIALSGGLLLARIQPPFVRALSRAAARRRGLVGFLGLARAARGAGDRARPSALPLIALLLAVTSGGFGATVLAAVDEARPKVARSTVGGDAQVAAPPGEAVPQEFAEAAGALPGVRTSLGVWTDRDAFLFGTAQGSTRVTVVVADPAAYAELARSVGRGGFDPALLGGAGGANAPVPALFSEDLTGQSPDGTYRLRLDNGEELRAKPAGVIDGSPVQPGAGAATIVLPAGPVTARVPEAALATHWFAIGSVDGDRLTELLRATAPALADQYLVRTSAALSAQLGSDPLQHAAGRLFWASLAAAACFALLAVLLSLVRAAPERGALLARLRTMGLRPRQGVAMVLTESQPQVLVAALGGALTATAAVALLGPSVDLSSLVGSAVPTGLRLSVRPVLTQALGLAALVALAVLAEAAVCGRRQITTELRAGDQS
ncbi:hypothetical protein ACWDYJ_28050 [Streptomyces sp. NPDC003042]